jgi:HEPN domain-containing protein
LHLSLEKFIKAKIVYDTKQHAPYSHDLPYLIGKTTIDCPEQILEPLRTISTFNMESRYPDQDLKFYKKATKAFTQDWINKGTKVRTWLHAQFKNK